MVLAADIGNSGVKFGFYCEDGSCRRITASTNSYRTFDECLMFLKIICMTEHINTKDISGAVVASVVPQASETWMRAIETLTGASPLLLSHGIKTGLNIRTDVHTELGADIVANTVAAASIMPSPFAVVDLGTAITISVSAAEGELTGVVIMPGVATSLKSLSDTASALPEITVRVPKDIIGRNTSDSMMSGTVYGFASMIDGMLERISERLYLNSLNIIACGGFADVIIPHCKRKIPVCESLTTDGLIKIFYLNESRKKRRQ